MGRSRIRAVQRLVAPVSQPERRCEQVELEAERVADLAAVLADLGISGRASDVCFGRVLPPAWAP